MKCSKLYYAMFTVVVIIINCSQYRIFELMSIQPYNNRLPNGVLFEIMIIMILPLSESTSFRSQKF